MRLDGTVSFMLCLSVCTTDAVVVPRYLASSYPIREFLINTPPFLVNTSTMSTSSVCNLPQSLGLIASESVVAINSNQLYTSNMQSTVCGMCITIYLGSNSTFNLTAVVADECVGCDDAAISLSPTLYAKLLQLPTLPNTTAAAPAQISWIESPCPTTPNRIPTMSLAWSSPSNSTFSSIQLYGLPTAITQVSVTWDSYLILQFSNATWTPLSIPASSFTSTPKSLGFWSLPPGVSDKQGAIGLQVVLRDGTILVTQNCTVGMGENVGDVVVGLWVPQGDVSHAVVLKSVLDDTTLRRRDHLEVPKMWDRMLPGWAKALLKRDGITLNLSDVTVQDFSYGV
ncbi:hypothetical protein BC830DRAFT_1101841 [Chytriomyces sp. MP71]|nr:hypothetical protein BC830DRAFT_1101841 [Chytriomyces sp. MP71]